MPTVTTRVPRGLVGLAVGAVATVTIALILLASSLYGDGSVMLIQAIQAGSSFVDRPRWLLNNLRDAPVVALVELGVTNLRTLAWAQGVGYLGWAGLVWTAAIGVSAFEIRRFVVVTTAAGVCFGALSSFGACELLLALGLVVLVTLLLSVPRVWSIWMAVVAVVGSLVLVISHEAIALCAVLWGVHAAARLRRATTAVERLAVTVILVAALACIAWAVATALGSPDGDTHGFFDAVTRMQPVYAPLLVAAAVGVALIALAPRSSLVVRLPLLALACAWTGVAVVLAVRLGPGAGYVARAWWVVAVLLAQMALALLWWRDTRLSRPDGGDRERTPSQVWPAWLASGFLVACLAIPVGNAVLWWQGLADIRELITSRSGPLDPQSELSELGRRALWHWTNPGLSVVLRASSDGAILLDPDTAAGRPAPWLLFPSLEAQEQLAPEFVWR